MRDRFGWFVGHLTLLFCSLRYGLSYITFNSFSRWARFSYRTAFVAAAATYGIVVYKAYRARAKSGSRQQGGALALAGDENVQYLGKSPFLSTRPLTESKFANPTQQWPSSGFSPAKSLSLSSRSWFTQSSMSQHTPAQTSSLRSSLPPPPHPLHLPANP